MPGQQGKGGGIANILNKVSGMIPGYPVNVGNANIKVGGVPGAMVNQLLNKKGNTNPAAAERFRNAGTGPSAAMNMMKIASGVGAFPGGKSGGKGAGGGRGQMQRQQKKEQRQTNRIMKQIESLTNPQTFMDQGMPEAEAIKMAEENTAKYGTPEDFRKYRFDNNFGMGSVYGTQEELRSAGINALPSLATPQGEYKNFVSEIMPWLQANNMDYANAPDPRIPQEELDDLSPLGIRSLPPWYGGG